MIDTILLRLDLHDKSLYDECYACVDYYLRTECNAPLRKKGKKYISIGLAKFGFLEIAFYHTKKNYLWEIKLQPIRLLRPNELVQLSQVNDFSDIAKGFHLVIGKLLNTGSRVPEDYRIDKWSVRRVDYALNYFTPYMDAYISVLHNGWIPTGFHNDEENKNYATSLYLISKSVNLNFYDKYAQLSTKKYLTENDIEVARNLLRFEVQCEKKELERLSRRFGLGKMTIVDFWNSNIARYVLHSRIASVIGELGFQRLSDAKDSLTGSGRMTAVYRKLLTMIAHAPNAKVAKETFCNAGYNSNRYEQYLYAIRKQGVNPITIPNDADLPADVKKLPNPCAALLEQ